ncbi:MAG: hypothetical protein R3B35_10000 [Gemmatimonadales bacterium]
MPHDSSFTKFQLQIRDVEAVYFLRIRAGGLFAMRSPTSFDGFGDFLDHLLPDDPEGVDRIGRSLRVLPGQLQLLRRSELDPAALEIDGFVQLAQYVGLDENSLQTLMARDHRRYERAQVDSFARNGASGGETAGALTARVHDAWERLAEDDPIGL